MIGWNCGVKLNEHQESNKKEIEVINDTIRLNFLLRTQAFIVKRELDIGGCSCQAWVQDEDENYKLLHADTFYKTERDAIDAAIDYGVSK
jgi:hypothetical protein